MDMKHYLPWYWHPKDSNLVWAPLPLLMWCEQFCLGSYHPTVIDNRPFMAFEQESDFVLFKSMWLMR